MKRRRDSLSDRSTDTAPAWRWAGRATVTRGCKHFASAVRESDDSDDEQLCVDVGDAVWVRLEGQDEPGIARIEALYESGTKKMFTAQWFAHPASIVRFRNDGSFHQKEVLFTDEEDQLELDTISEAVSVLPPSKFFRAFAIAKQQQQQQQKQLRRQRRRPGGDDADSGDRSDDDDDDDDNDDNEGDYEADETAKLFMCKSFYWRGTRLMRPLTQPIDNKGSYLRSNSILGTCRTNNDNKNNHDGDDGSDEDDENASPLERSRKQVNQACRRLHLSAVPDHLPCREEERAEIYSFIRTALLQQGQGGSALYISGMPGTGKTATVLEVIRTLTEEVESGDHPELPVFQFVEINGMRLPVPHAVYGELYRALTGRSVAHTQAALLLHKRFAGASHASAKRGRTKSKAHHPFCVVLVDELDYMVTRKQTVMYNLFDWPTHRGANLVVIGVANTMDLPERMLPRVHSRMGSGRVVFQPYKRDQINEIIKQRLSGLALFRNESINMCAAKVASCSGDVRRALNICRRAAEICWDRFQKAQSSDVNGGAASALAQSHSMSQLPSQSQPASTTQCSQSQQRTGSGVRLASVSIADVRQAVDEMQQNMHLRAIKTASLFVRVLLIAMHNHITQMGVSAVAFDDLWHRFYGLCKIKGLSIMPARDQTLALVLRLGATRLLVLESARNAREPVVRLGMDVDDIKMAYENDPSGLAELVR